MADFEIFREQLALKYPSYGYALWEPSPTNPNRPVQVGDVGFIREGRFYRLFSALLPADDPSQELGVPEYHKPLVPTVSDHVATVCFDPNNYCSGGVKVEDDQGHHSGPDDLPQVVFQNETTRSAAVLSLPVPSRRENTLLRNVFGRWMVKHIDTWLAFARKLGLVHQMEEIILVTGCDLTRSWTNVAFLGGRADSQVSFGVEVKGPASNPSINFQFSPGRVRGAVLHRGPEGTNLPENQCVFIRGFRVAPSIYFLPKRLKAAAGPSPDAGGYDCDSDMEVISIPAVTQFRDPLYLLSDYIAEQESECEKILVHDDDLLTIDGIGHDTSLETLEPDVMVDLLRKSNIKIYKSECDSFLAESQSGSNTDTSYVKVASLSMTFQDRSPTPPSQSPPPAAQKIDLSHASELRGTPQPTIPGNSSVTLERVSTEREPPLLSNLASQYLQYLADAPLGRGQSAGLNCPEVSSGSGGLVQPTERSLIEVITVFLMQPEPSQFDRDQGGQQWLPPSSENEDMWYLPTVDPFGFTPNYDTLYNDGGDYVFRDLPFSTPPIHFDFSTWSSAPAEASSTSTAGTPSLVSSSEPDYLSPPTMLAASPSTPANGPSPVCGVYDFGYPPIPVTPPPPPCLRSNTRTSPEPEHVIPFSEHQRGPMVPQKRYRPRTSSDRRRFVDEVELEPCIAFYMSKPDELGIPLRDALHGRFSRLVERDEPMFRDLGPSISLRINWPGYNPWCRQIPTKDFRTPPGPITRAKLAKNVAKSVARFIVEHQGRPMEEDGEPIWGVGARKIEVNDLALVRLDHVSKNSWQAQLQLLRPLNRS